MENGSAPLKTRAFFAPRALLPDGWAEHVRIGVNDAGKIVSVEAGASPGDAALLAGPLVPGMPNLHSHAFQRAMAGLTERRENPADSFWTWRDLMYRFANRISPGQLRAVAAQLFIDMLKAGYTGVAEFHYVHHAPGGAPYDDPAEMALQLAQAASDAGIGLTLLPVLYVYGGFGGRPLSAAQARFASDPATIAAIIEGLGSCPGIRVGVAPHSLRAVSLPMLSELLVVAPANGPVHIHIAEQVREVEECVANTGRRPVEFLFDNFEVDARWCLVHATHMNEAETQVLAKSGAVAGLCPITEANLGDGFFPLRGFLDQGGRFGIGSDSNISPGPWEELRLLEYGQRLLHRERAVAIPAGQTGSTGLALYRSALAGGAQALGQGEAGIAPGADADFCVLDPARLPLGDCGPESLLDQAVFASAASPVRDVWVRGIQIIAEGHHAGEAETRRRFDAALRELGDLS
ncbi:MAG: formimidoylglutamate deiminase [Parvibaculaceae bacterium]|nr:formimidoylglutamate deiminase [Parvibaculaceae bacterium]